MSVKVLFFASLREQVGERQLALTPAPASVRELAQTLENRYEGLSLSGALCAVNEHYAQPDASLHEGDTVAFFPPVSGG